MLIPSLAYLAVAVAGVAIVTAILLFNRHNSHERSYRRRMRRESSAYRKLMADKHRSADPSSEERVDA